MSIIDENVRISKDSLEVLRAQGARIDFEIKVKKTRSLRLGIN